MTTEPGGRKADASSSAGATLDEQLGALSLRPGFDEALFDSDHPGHRAALAERRRIFEAHHGNEPAATVYGSSDPQIVLQEDGSYGLTAPPSENEMFDVAARSASLAMQSEGGMDAPSADALGAAAAELGIDAALLVPAIQEIASRGETLTTEAAMAELGSEGHNMVRRANSVIAKIEGLDKFLAARPEIANSPRLIRVLSDHAQRMGL